MVELVTGPAEADILALVSVAQLKAEKRVVNAREDGVFEDCLLDAWSWIDGPEGKCRRAILPQTWRIDLPRFPSDPHRLPVHGARQITAVTYLPGGGGPRTTLGAGSYWLDRSSDGMTGSLAFPAGFAPPALGEGAGAVQVEFQAGWDTPAAVPRVFRRVLKLVAAHFYDNREETFGDNRVSHVSRRIELGAEELLRRYIVPLDYAGAR